MIGLKTLWTWCLLYKSIFFWMCGKVCMIKQNISTRYLSYFLAPLLTHKGGQLGTYSPLYLQNCSVTHINGLRLQLSPSTLTRKDSSSTYSNTCCHALDPGAEWVSRGETPLWLWRLQPLNISDNSEESLRVKSRLWPFSESDLWSRFSLEWWWWWWWWYRRWLRMQVSWPVTSTSKLDTRLVTSISTAKYITCSIVTRDMYKYKYTCTSCKRIVTCDSISTEKYNMCKYCGLWQVL